jgi:hypothetical protein
LLVGFLVVVEVCLLMLAGWLWAGLAVQHPEAGLLAGVVGLGAPFHWSMALFLDAPPPVGDRLGTTIPGHQPISAERVTFSLRFEGPTVLNSGHSRGLIAPSRAGQLAQPSFTGKSNDAAPT